MRQPNRRTGLVDVLTARTAGTEYIHLNIFRTNVYFHIVINFRHDFYCGERSVPSAGGIERRYPNQTMHTRFWLQESIGIFALNQNGGTLQAGFIAIQIIQCRYLEMMPFCPAVIHPVEHFCPVLCFCPTCSGVERQNCIGVVIFSGEQRCQFHFFQLLNKSVAFCIHIRCAFCFALFERKFNQCNNIFQFRLHLLIGIDAVFQCLGFLQHFLRMFQIIPESFFCNFFL